MAAGAVPDIGGGAFILVDPLDGTREFINRNGDFTVNIALVRDGAPSIGAVYAPARNTLYAGRPGEATVAELSPDGVVLSRRPMAARAAANPRRIVASRSHRTPETDSFIDRYPGAETVSVGSSLKFCLLANGEADLYPRFGRTMEWDTAAGDAVLRAAGGTTTLVDGDPFVYGKREQADDVDFANPWFIARGA
jgi:3'(2'), 5'-bisphosphate nucleotidase